ncbi:hypothetical protein [Streptomyces sp. 142MFCol3.1]|uniref:hypothetical protein n=1 Tax=Streptomyces sp. 142MFCol3.1 TaxID=1172179 RepID=UPI0004207853|nr:hypothetical protein [Streptomyces sp. 142MFCol3.1]
MKIPLSVGAPAPDKAVAGIDPGTGTPDVPGPEDRRTLKLPGRLAPFAGELEIRPATDVLPLSEGGRQDAGSPATSDAAPADGVHDGI